MHNTENNIAQNERIQQHINKRYENFTTNTTSMINSILECHQEPVIFHNIRTPSELIHEPMQIKQYIRDHYEQWTKYNPPDLSEWPKWQQEYQPKPHIQQSWYQHLDDLITLPELQNTINNSPINKAPGPSLIANEMIKKAGNTFLKILLLLFNKCLLTQTIPKNWKQSNIYPISKKPIFTKELNHTHPITLIEHTRKIYTKIITNRINTILNQYPILNNNNFVALPHSTTTTPIQILRHIFEDSTTYNKEIWTLSQDMSKAYDIVHVPLLIKALNRIKIPKTIQHIILDILSHRQNQIITNLGNTQHYIVQDGIDQGETITPILWRIYYDPLLAKVYRLHKGYILLSHINLLQLQSTEIQTNYSTLAFMNDTL